MFARIAIAVTAAAIATAPAASADPAVVEMPYCATEDGSDYPNRYCLWIDPDTGRGYVNLYSSR